MNNEHSLHKRLQQPTKHIMSRQETRRDATEAQHKGMKKGLFQFV
jgi:hypothetical protein